MFFFDQLLAGTPFRGLVIQGFAGYCAYIGVPKDHCLSDMEGLEFDCHGEITFRGDGDGDIRPEGWYWYGWDYQHPGDKTSFPDGLLDEMPPELVGMLERANSTGKAWTHPEIEHELIDAAVALMDVLDAAQRAANDMVGAAMNGASGFGGTPNT